MENKSDITARTSIKDINSKIIQEISKNESIIGINEYRCFILGVA